MFACTTYFGLLWPSPDAYIALHSPFLLSAITPYTGQCYTLGVCCTGYVVHVMPLYVMKCNVSTE
jgi:hypothetical protein